MMRRITRLRILTIPPETPCIRKGGRVRYNSDIARGVINQSFLARAGVRTRTRVRGIVFQESSREGPTWPRPDESRDAPWAAGGARVSWPHLDLRGFKASLFSTS